MEGFLYSKMLLKCRRSNVWRLIRCLCDLLMVGIGLLSRLSLRSCCVSWGSRVLWLVQFSWPLVLPLRIKKPGSQSRLEGSLGVPQEEKLGYFYRLEGQVATRADNVTIRQCPEWAILVLYGLPLGSVRLRGGAV